MPSVDNKAAAAAATAAHTSPLQELLQRPARATADSTVATTDSGQVLLGTLKALPTGQRPGLVEVSGLGALNLTQSLVPLGPAQLGRTAALTLLAPQQALLLGMLWDPNTITQTAESDGPDRDAATSALSLTVDGHREVIEAAQELELRCGDACIVLTADGRIQLRGTYITSHASATQRITGGSVQLN